MNTLQRAFARLREWRENPAKMVHEEFGVKEIDHFQLDLLKAFPDPKKSRIAMKANKGPGKTAGLAWVGLNFLACYGEVGNHPKGAVTSVTKKNLDDNLWTELAKWMNRSEFLKSAFTWTKERIFANDHPETWYLSKRTWAKDADSQQQSETLAGLHSDYLLYLLDEMGGYPRAIVATAEAGLVGGPFQKIVGAGNPTNLDSPLYDACTKFRGMWHVITITGDPDNPRRAKRVSKEWARQQIKMYGRDNPWVLINVFGEFPPHSLNALIGPDEIERSMSRYGAIKEHDYNWSQKRIGIDAARYGDDRTVAYPRQGLVSLKPVILRHRNGPEIATRVLTMINRWTGQVIVFVDDTGGYGATVIDSLMGMGHSSVPINFGGSAIDPRFANRRSEMYWNMCDWIRRGGAIHPEMQELIPELTETTYTYDKKTRLILEEKDLIKEKIGRSPDLADALALTFANPDSPDFSSPEGQYVAASSGAGQLETEWDPTED